MFLSQQDTGPTEVLGTTATPVPLTATPVPLTATPVPLTATPVPLTATPGTTDIGERLNSDLEKTNFPANYVSCYIIRSDDIESLEGNPFAGPKRCRAITSDLRKSDPDVNIFDSSQTLLSIEDNARDRQVEVWMMFDAGWAKVNPSDEWFQLGFETVVVIADYPGSEQIRQIESTTLQQGGLLAVVVAMPTDFVGNISWARTDGWTPNVGTQYYWYI